MSVAFWSLLLGLLLIAMVLAGSLLSRLMLSSAMVYLGIGYLLGPAGLALVTPDPAQHSAALEQMAEAALLISLFSVGLEMGSVPLLDRRWRLPLRLAFFSMTITVGLIAAVGVWGLGLPLGAAVLLGAILAPTDPVLASGVKTGPGTERLHFSLAGEGGLNDGTAFPFVMLGIGLMGGHELGAGAWRWWAVDVLWATLGGLLIGAGCGALVGRLVGYLRTRKQPSAGLDEFLSIGLLAAAYGAATLCLASGFLAVFAAGLALRRSQDIGARMTDAVQHFNEKLEGLAELAIVLVVGAMLSYTAPMPALWWFVPVLLLVLRPVAFALGTLGEPMTGPQRAMIGWFGIRGIGSVFYLLFAIRHGVTGPLAQELVTLTLVTVAVSIIVHGTSARPLMARYLRVPSSSIP